NGTARLDVGGGIVWDSTPEAEYEEALWKTRFARI
ncbi:MAG TPA: chorismate-binding protein, partial [Paracoccaceae bacterium]|nr:chorismate-binding protein [Paracoccaceae bacterium]